MADPPAPRSASEIASAGTLRQPVFYALLAGLCPLIPVPWLDDAVEGWVRRRQVLDAFRSRRIALSGDRLALLTGAEERSPWRGCLRALLLIPLFFWLVKRLFRKLVVLLTLKDCADRFSVAFHEGFLIVRALDRGWFGEHARPEVSSTDRAVRAAMADVQSELDSSPIYPIARRLFRGSRLFLVAASRRLVRLVRRSRDEPEEVDEGSPAERELDREEARIRGWVDRAAGAVAEQASYLEELDRKLAAAFEARRRTGAA